MKTLVELDFEKLIVAHWEPVVTEARPAVERAMQEFGIARQ